VKTLKNVNVAQESTKTSFSEHLNNATNVVRSWPQWKQDVLGQTKGHVVCSGEETKKKKS